ncbi:hypothetical protein GEMRC1_011678 [Eukaryota sp. GEM-RC1]
MSSDSFNSCEGCIKLRSIVHYLQRKSKQSNTVSYPAHSPKGPGTSFTSDLLTSELQHESIHHYEIVISEQQKIISQLADELDELKYSIKSSKLKQLYSTTFDSPPPTSYELPCPNSPRLSSLTLQTLNITPSKDSLFIGARSPCNKCTSLENELKYASKEISDLRSIIAEKESKIRRLQSSNSKFQYDTYHEDCHEDEH